MVKKYKYKIQKNHFIFKLTLSLLNSHNKNREKETLSEL